MSSIHDPRYQKLIKHLIRIRELKNVTQVELASSLKKHQSYVSKIENFDRRIDIIELYDWLNALNEKLVNSINSLKYKIEDLEDELDDLIQDQASNNS